MTSPPRRFQYDLGEMTPVGQFFYDPHSGDFKDIPAEGAPVGCPSVTAKERTQLELDLSNGREITLLHGEVFSVMGSHPKHSMTYLRQTLLAAGHCIMHEKALEYGYTSVSEAVSYANDPVDTQFNVEGRSFLVWRSLVRRACLNLAEELHQSNAVIPRNRALEAYLPKFELLP